MCIRDRPVLEQQLQAGFGPGRAIGQWAPIGVEEATLGGDPVSYTHLRAHETVLDLVCRLLLEKKKHK